MTGEPVFELHKARMGELLVQRGVLTEAQLSEALQEHEQTAKFLGAILVSRGWVSEEEVARALSEQLGLAYVDLVSHPVDPDSLELIPEDLRKTHLAVPLFAAGDSVTVAMANPLDIAAVEQLQQAIQKHIRPVFATPSAIRRVLGGAGPAEKGAPDPTAKMKAVASLAPVVQLVDSLIGEAVTSRASDIHLEPASDQFHCRFRIDGILYDRPPFSKEFQAAVISRIKIMGNMDIAEKRLPQDGRVQLTAAGTEVDLRVSTFPTLYGENVVIRILDKKRTLLTLEEVGFSKSVLDQFMSLIAKTHGIILVTGPTGSGKTSTLYAALNRLNNSEVNIMTLEDPVEYELPRIRQSQVNLKAGLTFATGLRSMVRQDPNIILIGEIRDKETADIAIHASLTGHLVFSTLHTNDAASAATRLVDLGVEPFLVATSLVGVLAQRLVRTLCTACKTPVQAPPQLLDRLGVPAGKRGSLFQEKGCSHCRQTGYQGRIGLFELLVPSEKVRGLIAQKAPAGIIREEVVRNGMGTLREDGLKKLMQGVTSVSEVLRVTGNE